LDWLRAGRSVPDIVDDYPRLTFEAVVEAISLATEAFQAQFGLRAA